LRRLKQSTEHLAVIAKERSDWRNLSNIQH